MEKIKNFLILSIKFLYFGKKISKILKKRKISKIWEKNCKFEFQKKKFQILEKKFPKFRNFVFFPFIGKRIFFFFFFEFFFLFYY